MASDLQTFGSIPAWLADVADAATVRAALDAALPEVRTGSLVITDLEPLRLRLGSRSWVGSYVVTLRTNTDEEPRVVRLRGSTTDPGEGAGPAVRPAAFGDPSWRVDLADLRLTLETESPDAELPALPLLTDPESARALLEQSIRGAGPAYRGYRLRSCTPQVVRYKPGSRCTVLYRLDYPDDVAGHRWPDVVVAKTYRGDKGEVAWNGMRALWHSPMATSGVAIAEPLAFLPAVKVLVQGPVPGDRTLKDAIRRALATGGSAERAELTRTIEATAAGLAALHGSGVRHGDLVTWDDERADVRRIIDRLTAHVPQLEGSAEQLLGRLAAVAAAHPADPPVPAHGSFRPGQVLISDGSVGFIDFDAFCQAEPARDIALFCTTLRQLEAGPEHLEALGRIGDEFVSAYTRHAAVSPVRVALWEAVDLLTRVLNCWTKVKPDKLPEAMAALERQLAGAPLRLAL